MDLLFYLIVGAVIGAVCFTIGWKVAIHPDIVSNERALERQKELNLEINTQEARIEVLKNEKEKLQQQYNETQQFISDAEKNAETIYATKCAQLEDKYKQKEKELQAIQEEKKESFAADIKKIEDDLESLKATKLAAIDAARKEQLIKQKQEDYIDNSTLQNIADAVDKKIEDIESKKKKIVTNQVLAMQKKLTQHLSAS